MLPVPISTEPKIFRLQPFNDTPVESIVKKNPNQESGLHRAEKHFTVCSVVVSLIEGTNERT